MSNRGHPPIYEPAEPDYGLVIESAAYKKNGGSICCGHTKWVWKMLKTASGGEMLLCNKCGQYLAVILGLPWVCQGHEYGGGKYRQEPHTNHLDGKWLMPVDARVSID